MLEDGFASRKYSAILGNLRDHGYLDDTDVESLLKNYRATERIDFEGISQEKAKLVTWMPFWPMAPRNEGPHTKRFPWKSNRP